MRVSDMLRAYGRVCELRRRVGTGPEFVSVELLGYLRGYKPVELVGGVIQGDANLLVETPPESFGGPRKGDLAVVDGLTWAVQGASPRMLGAETLGYDLWVRGGK